MNESIYVFDADGTLTDTAPAHVRFCNDLNREFNFQLPEVNPETPEAVRRVLGTPMSSLLRKYGFPEERIEELDNLYKARFSTDPRYASKPFQGIPEMLRKIKAPGKRFVLLTSNHLKNVKRDLVQENLKLFDMAIDKEDLDRFHEGRKANALNYCIHDVFALSPQDFVFVGDTYSDFMAANEAGTKFTGVSYGWQIPQSETRFPVAANAKELEAILLNIL
jgi:phosphoglycolate phosphatase